MAYDCEHKDFPSMSGYDANDEWYVLPQFQRLRALLQAGKPITASMMYGQFTDDHLPCYNASVVVDGEEFKFGLWCIVDAKFMFALARAPHDANDHKRVVELILEETAPEDE